MMMKDVNDIKKQFWDSRAGLGYAAGTNDETLKHIEVLELAKYISDGMDIMDFGCGNGITAYEIATRNKVSILGVDSSGNMICEALKNKNSKALKGCVQFEVGDHNTILHETRRYDCIYSERALINLASWSEQALTISRLIGLLKPGGRYIMCESSQDGLDEINRLRLLVGLSPIASPWHNTYFRDNEVKKLCIDGARLVEINSFSSTYYFLSRIVNASMAALENRVPDYADPLNLLAYKLPPIGKCSQTKIWVWESFC